MCWRGYTDAERVGLFIVTTSLAPLYVGTINNICLPCCWWSYLSQYPEGDTVLGALPIVIAGFGYSGCGGGVNFNGRGFYGKYIDDMYVERSCGSADQYVYIGTGGTHILVDVFRAFGDNVWTSSVQITVSLLTENAGSADINVGYNPPIICPRVSKHIPYLPGTPLSCQNFAVKATVTVNADGTYSIA